MKAQMIMRPGYERHDHSTTTAARVTCPKRAGPPAHKTEGIAQKVFLSKFMSFQHESDLTPAALSLAQCGRGILLGSGPCRLEFAIW